MNSPPPSVGEDSSEERLPFTLILSGGGARGFAHVGVLRALEGYGFRPSAVVGVSMGAVVGATYSLRPADWYPALLAMDTRAFPRPLHSGPAQGRSARQKLRRLFAYLHASRDLFLDWGVGIHALAAGTELLRSLTMDKNLEDGRIPIAVCATDLRAGARVVFHSGNAGELVYASSALAGVLPPLRRGDWLLSDGAYADLVPIDVARSFGNPVVIAVNAGQALERSEIRTGFQALTRAVDICQLTHAHVRFGQADLALLPVFRRPIDTLDFDARRECIAAGIAVVRRNRAELRRLLGPLRPPISQDALSTGGVGES